MPWEGFLYSLGSQIETGALRVPRARDLTKCLGGLEIGAPLHECRQNDTSSSLIVDVESEVGQQPKNDIRRIERVALTFSDADDRWPPVHALRAGFPKDVPHLNASLPDEPPSLCLSEEPFSDAKRTLTAPLLVRRLQRWFKDTALSALHEPDQPIEPFLWASKETLIVPHTLYVMDDGAGPPLFAERCVENDDTYWRLTLQPQDPANAPLLAITFTVPPLLHGVIHSVPASIADLGRLVNRPGYDLVSVLRSRLGSIAEKHPPGSDPPIILIIRFPMLRSKDGEPEYYDIRAFHVDSHFNQMGAKLGLWEVRSGVRAHLIPPASTPDGHDISVCPDNVMPTLSAESAANYSKTSLPQAQRIVAIGAGALGSNVLMNLARMGVRPSAVIDKERLLPHNLARHALLAAAVGHCKATELADALRGVTDDDEQVEVICEDVLAPATQSPRTVEVFLRGTLLLDMSASVGVARHLATATVGDARRASLFLNPSGTDLVLLAEDCNRHSTLDQVELQYYWELSQRRELSGHLTSNNRIRYAQGCRDRSFQIRETSISILAGIGAQAVRDLLDYPHECAVVWRLDEPSLTVAKIDISVRPMLSVRVGAWSCFISRALLHAVVQARSDALPTETGGVLLGNYDLVAKRIYLGGTLPSPSDSDARPTSYIRGYKGLQGAVEQCCERAGLSITYVGEWHSHPGPSAKPSQYDEEAYLLLSDLMRRDGYPETMIVLGENELYCLVEDERVRISLGDV